MDHVQARLADIEKNYRDIFKDRPLCVFSIDTDTQIETVTLLAHEIRAMLNRAIDGQNIEGRFFTLVLGSFWLWVIGTWEIVRTMDQHKACFAEPVREPLTAFKRRLRLIRVPFAKQEVAGKNKPTYSETSVDCFNKATKDLGFTAGDQKFWICETIAEFETLILSFTNEMILFPLGGEPPKNQAVEAPLNKPSFVPGEDLGGPLKRGERFDLF